MNNLVNNASSLSLTSERLKVFTRYEVYRCKIPPTKNISNSAFRKFPQMPSLISQCEHKFLPPVESYKILLMEHYSYTKLVVLESFLFCQKIKNVTGDMSPPWFMTDIAPQFCDAFCVAFNCEPIQLYCTWHVLWSVIVSLSSYIVHGL